MIDTSHVYIVYEYGGEYEDKWENIQAVFFSEDRANDYKATLVEKEKLNQEFDYKLYCLGDLDYERENRFYRMECHKVIDCGFDEDEEAERNEE